MNLKAYERIQSLRYVAFQTYGLTINGISLLTLYKVGICGQFMAQSHMRQKNVKP